MGAPTRGDRLAHARIHCEYWNEGRKDEWVASWRTIAQGEVRMFDPVGTKEKRGFAHATTEAYDMFQPHLKMQMVTVQVNGDEMAWTIDNRFTMNGETLQTYSIETFAWDADGNLTIKTYYDLPADVGENDDPYEFLLGAGNVISND